MAKSCDFKTTEASTKAWLRDKKMIDKNLNIPEGMLGAFREQNTHWSKQAFKRFHSAGIQPGDRLFYEEQNGKRALPNKEMFHRIDAHKGNFYKEKKKYLNEMSTRTPVQTIINSKDRIIQFDSVKVKQEMFSKWGKHIPSYVESQRDKKLEKLGI